MAGAAAEPNSVIIGAASARSESIVRTEVETFYSQRTHVSRRFNRYNDLEIEASTVRHDSVDAFVMEINMERRAWEVRNLIMNIDPIVLRNACFWVSLPVPMACFLSALLSLGFTVHHATAARFVLVIRNSHYLHDLALAACSGRSPAPVATENVPKPLAAKDSVETQQQQTQASCTSNVDQEMTDASSSSNPQSENETPNLPIPEYGTHYCRVECITIHRVAEAQGVVPYALMVKERFGKIYRKDTTGEMYAQSWKFVSGSVNSGEFFSHAALREVLEETGISTVFVGVVGLCNRLQTRFLRDELVVCCLLVTPHIATLPLLKQSDEILNVAWIPVEMLNAALSSNAPVYTDLAMSWLASATTQIRNLCSCVSVPGEKGCAVNYLAKQTQSRLPLFSQLGQKSALIEFCVVDKKTQKPVHNYILL